jgi:hypothetical protein
MIRLPNGLPDAQAAQPYLKKESLVFLKDKQGPGGVLSVHPFHEPGDLGELWNVNALLDRLLPLRAEILDGDLRPLYLAHLAASMDGYLDPNEEKDAPVPAGLDKLTSAQRALAELYELDEALIAAAAQNCPSLPERMDSQNRFKAWLRRQPAAAKNEWLSQLMADPPAAVRREILAAFQKSQNALAWPTIRVDRTIAEIESAAEVIQSKKNRQRAVEAARQRAEKLANMAADPMRTLRETEKLVKQRSIEAYSEVATLLADLREALSGSDQASLPDQQARKLKKENPTLSQLTSKLRGKGFLRK